jgi:5-methylthioadenosine/S-adenosylhomocysteine deaminase
MIDGQIVVEDGRLRTADLKELISRVHEVVPGLFARRAAFLARNQHGTVQWTDASAP